MVQLADRQATIPEADARAAITTSSNYWQAMSNGRLSMSVDSVENRTSKATSTQSYSSMMNTIAGEIGWVPSSYTALVVFVSTPTLSDGAYGAGWSYNGTSGRVLMPLPATLTKSVLTHEFGHVLGLMHANRLRCTNGAVDTASNADGSFANGTCSVEEYKDNLDLMGVSQASQPIVSSPIYEFGGFGSGNEVRDLGKIAAKGSYQLNAWGSADDNRAIKFTDPVSGEAYYLELRLPVGYDAATAVGGNRGVKVVQAYYGSGSIALQPSTTTFNGYYSYNQAWQAGQTFTTHAGTRVSIDWISSTSAGVTIESVAGVAAKAIEPVASSTASLGSATSGVLCGLRDGGCYQAFQGGTVHWAPGVGAFATSGLIRYSWGDLGYENGKLGYPVTNEICGLANGGCYQGFQGGTIHWAPGSGAYATWGGIRTLWGKLGYENGKLGYPTSNESCGLVNGGCYQSFQNGDIHYAPGIGALRYLGRHPLPVGVTRLRKRQTRLPRHQRDLRARKRRLLPGFPEWHHPLRPRRRRLRHLGRDPLPVGVTRLRKRQTRLPRHQRNLRPRQRRLLPGLPERHHPLRPRHRRLRHLGRHPHRLGVTRLRKRQTRLPRHQRNLRPRQRRLLPGLPERHHPLRPRHRRLRHLGRHPRPPGGHSATKTANSATPSPTKSAASPTAAATRASKTAPSTTPPASAPTPPPGQSALLGEPWATKTENSATPSPTKPATLPTAAAPSDSSTVQSSGQPRKAAS